LFNSSGSGGARKGSQHQSTVVDGQQLRTNRSESLDRSYVGLVSGSDVSRLQQRVTGQDGPLLSHISPNLSDSKRHTAATESRLVALKSGQVHLAGLLSMFRQMTFAVVDIYYSVSFMKQWFTG